MPNPVTPPGGGGGGGGGGGSVNPPPPPMIEYTLNQVDGVVTSAIVNGYNNVVASIQPALTSMLILSLVIFGYALMVGWVSMRIGEAAKRLAAILIVYTLVVTNANTADLLQKIAIEGPEQLAGDVASAAGGGSPSGGNEKLQNLLDEGSSAAGQVFENSGYTDFLSHLIALSIYLVTILLVGYSLFLVVLAKVAITPLLMLSPLFIPMVLLSSTRGFFEGWLRQVANFALVPILLYAVIALMGDIVIDQAENIVNNGAEMTYIVPFVLLATVNILLVMQVMGIAGGLAGGISISGMGVAGMAAGRLFGSAKGTLRAGSKAIRWRRDREQRRNMRDIAGALRHYNSGSSSSGIGGNSSRPRNGNFSRKDIKSNGV